MAIRTLTLSTPLAASGTATFSVYSVHGDGAKSPLDLDNRDSYEVSDGQLIHMVAPGNLSLYIHNVSGLSETDLRKINFEVDYGERWDAQFLTDPHLPAGFTTPAPDGATMGLYPGYISGHAMRGTDMSGNQVLTETYAGDGGAEGTKDNTVTVTVSDGVNSASMSFTVRLIHPLKYYAVGGANYPVGYNGTRAQQRLGVIYVSRDGDFTGCPTGPNIYHHTIPSGVIRKSGMFRFWSNGADREADEVITDTSDGSALQDYPFVGNDPSAAVYFKAGETYVGADELSFETFNGVNCLVSSWGTANNGRAIFSGEPRQTWSPTNLAFMSSNEVGAYRGLRFQNIDFHMSDYDPTDTTWTEWWNIIKYSNKSGTFTENSQSNMDGNTYNGEFLQNAGGTVQTQIIRDVDNGDGTGEFWCRHVLDASVGYNGLTDFDPAKVFVDGETLTGQTNLGTVTFVASGSRQDRPNKTPPSGIASSGALDKGGEIGCVFDGCIFRGGENGLTYLGAFSIISDTIVKNYWNYGIFGFGNNFNMSAVVISAPSTDGNGDPFTGQIRPFDTGNNPNKSSFNTIVGGSDPTLPTYNNISHTCFRVQGQVGLSMHKVGMHGYGGHTDGYVAGAIDVWASSTNHQPLMRMAQGEPFETTEPGRKWVYQYGCFFSGGAAIMQNYDATAITGPARAWVVDTCTFRAAQTNTQLLSITSSNFATKNCTFRWDEDPDQRALGKINGEGQFQFFKIVDFPGDGNDDATNLPDPENALLLEDCSFVFQGVSMQSVAGNLDVVWPTLHRDRTVTYTNCTTNIDATQFNVVNPIP